MYEQKPGEFTLFKNDKQGVENRPDYTGTGLDLQGNPIRVAAWLKQGRNVKFMACKIQLKDDRQVPKEKPKSSGFEDMPDDLPF